MQIAALSKTMFCRRRRHVPTNNTLRMIKLATFLMLLACLQLSARSYGQQITLSKKNAPLQELFLDIYKQSGYFFYCRDELLVNAKKVTIQVRNAGLEEVLAICFRDQPLTYTISDHVIVVRLRGENARPKMEPLTEIHGRVLDEHGDPLSGVTVYVKGSSEGTSTNSYGEFRLPISQNETILVFSGITTEPAELALNGKNDLLVILKTKVLGLQDVVVNKGYYTTAQKYNTGAVSKITSQEIERQPISNPLEALEGRMAGVYIQQTSGVSGSGINVEIRGLNSLRNNGNLPLYIIDGVPTTSASLDQNTAVAGQITPNSSPFNSINPSDIEFIEILKDADATAIYGSRGANGVVLITTKKGKAGKARLNLSANTGAGAITRMMKLLDSRQYLQMRHEAFQNDGESYQPYDYDLTGDWDTTRFTDWQKKMIGGTAHITNIQASINAGSQNTQFLLGGGYFRESTVFPGDFSDQKASAHLKLNHSSENRKLDLSLSVNYVADFNNIIQQDPTYSALNLVPVGPAVSNANGGLNWDIWKDLGNPYALFFRPYTSTTNNLIANTVLGYEILPGLSIKTSLGYNNIQLRQMSLTPISSQNPKRIYLTGSGNYSSNNFNSWIIEPQMEFQKNLGQGKLSILAGATFQQNIGQNQSFFATGFTNDGLLEDMQAAPNVFVAVSSYNQYRYNAIFGRLNYILSEKYVVNLTGRRDGSSRFGPGKQFSNFGAVGLAWIFSKESLVQRSVPGLSFGKLRASYGSTGNDQIGDYGYLDTYTPIQFPYNGTSGLTISRLFNPDFAWETNKKMEVALELGFLKDRIYFTASYYRNRSSNQLVGYPLPAITGESSLPFFNLPATVQNSGWEFELNARIIARNKFSWSVSLNLTLPKNKLIAYPGIEKSSYANTYAVGQSLYVQKKFHYLGVDPQTGVYLLDTKNADGIPGYPDDLQTRKEVARTYFGGLDNSFRFRDFQLSIFIQVVHQTGFNYLREFTAPGTFNNQPRDVLSRWQHPGDNSHVQQFTQDYGSKASNAFYAVQSSDQIISDASFIRIKNIALSYTFASSGFSKTALKNCKLFIEAQNLLTVTHFTGLDPETQSLDNIPPLRLLTAGIQITL